MDIMKMINDEQLRDDLPEFRVGDTVDVHYRIVEGERERIQIFSGVVIKIQGSGPSKTFTVRRISYGVGVERTFPIHSPRIGKLVLVRSGKTRRAKLYYLRERQGRAARVKEKRKVIKTDDGKETVVVEETVVPGEAKAEEAAEVVEAEEINEETEE